MAVRWYRTPGSAVLLDGVPVGGYWGSRGNRIVLPEDVLDNGAAVRHEMLHALLQVRGHPREQFLERCASVVDCVSSCVRDAGPWQLPPTDYEVLPPDSLEVNAATELLPPEGDGQRWVELRVSVRNPRDGPVVVAAPGASATPGTFAFDVRGPEGGVSQVDVADDSSRLYFHSNETKTRLFEFRVDPATGAHHILTGRNLVRGGYARRWTPYDTVIVVP